MPHLNPACPGQPVSCPPSQRASAVPPCQVLLSPARGSDRKLKINVPRGTCASGAHGAEDVPSMATWVLGGPWAGRGAWGIWPESRGAMQGVEVA